MIGQHLALRCRHGCFDSTNQSTAGFKTAAVSQNIAMLNKLTRSKLDDVANQRGILPEGLAAAAGVNRGVLKISDFMGVTLVTRTYRVIDHCDGSGSVNYSHTYLLTDREREFCLTYPEILLREQNFETYDHVEQRSGSFSRAADIRVDDSISLLNNSGEIPFDPEIWEKLGFDESLFVPMVARLCDALQTRNTVAVILPEALYNTTYGAGGCLPGEQLMAALMKLLPMTQRKIFSGVSIWDRDYGSSAADAFRFRVISTACADVLPATGITVIDLRYHTASDTSASSYAGYLWQIRNNQEKLKEFHNFIAQLLGPRIDEISKGAALMDLVTDMYLYHLQAETSNASKLAIRVFQNFGPVLNEIPAVDIYCRNLLQFMKENGVFHEELIHLLCLLLKDVKVQQNKIYSSLIEYLLEFLYTTEKTYTAPIIKEVYQAICRKINLADKIAVDTLSRYLEKPMPVIVQNNAWMYVLLELYLRNEMRNDKVKREILGRFAVHLQKLYGEQQWDSVYILICGLPLGKLNTVIEFTELCRIYGAMLRSGRENYWEIASDILYRNVSSETFPPEHAQIVWKNIFSGNSDDPSEAMELLKEPKLFRTFVSVWGKLTEKDHKIWLKQYETALQKNIIDEQQTPPEKELVSLPPQRRQNYYIELEQARHRYTNEMPSWSHVEQIFSCCPDSSDRAKFDILFKLYIEMPSEVKQLCLRDSILKSGYRFLWYYGLRLYVDLSLIDHGKWEEECRISRLYSMNNRDQSSLWLQNIRLCIQNNESTGELHQETAELYFKLWQNTMSAYGKNISIRIVVMKFATEYKALADMNCEFIIDAFEPYVVQKINNDYEELSMCDPQITEFLLKFVTNKKWKLSKNAHECLEICCGIDRIQSETDILEIAEKISKVNNRRVYLPHAENAIRRMADIYTRSGLACLSAIMNGQQLVNYYLISCNASDENKPRLLAYAMTYISQFASRKLFASVPQSFRDSIMSMYGNAAEQEDAISFFDLEEFWSADNRMRTAFGESYYEQMFNIIQRTKDKTLIKRYKKKEPGNFEKLAQRLGIK